MKCDGELADGGEGLRCPRGELARLGVITVATDDEGGITGVTGVEDASAVSSLSVKKLSASSMMRVG